MKRHITVAAIVLLTAVCAQAQSKKVSSPAPKQDSYTSSPASKKQAFNPKSGDFSFGIQINPMAAKGFSTQPKGGDFLGNWVNAFGTNPQQMVIPGQPLVSLKMKKYLSDHTAFKAVLGFNGSCNNYREYVQDDLAKVYDPNSEAVVADCAKANLAGGNLILGFESHLGKGRLQFVAGIDLIYSVCGGVLHFDYGNPIASYNGWTPSTMAWMKKDGDLNDFKNPALTIEWARPATTNNIGFCQQLGLCANLGVECFIYDRISAEIGVAIVPVAFSWQPQTWGIYEGYSAVEGRILQYNRLVSPGSRSLTYGTDNFAINIGINYYF